MNEYTAFKELAGKTVTAVEVNADRDSITFKTTDGDEQYEADGDCCSHSWFEHVGDPATIIGSSVVDVVERPMPESEQTDDYGSVVKFYGWTIQTAKGGLDIEMRNSSNGYYGGFVEHVG